MWNTKDSLTEESKISKSLIIQSKSNSFSSLHCTNETVNIWTHALGFLYFSYQQWKLHNYSILELASHQDDRTVFSLVLLGYQVRKSWFSRRNVKCRSVFCYPSCITYLAVIAKSREDISCVSISLEFLQPTFRSTCLESTRHSSALR